MLRSGSGRGRCGTRTQKGRRRPRPGTAPALAIQDRRHEHAGEQPRQSVLMDADHLCRAAPGDRVVRHSPLVGYLTALRSFKKLRLSCATPARPARVVAASDRGLRIRYGGDSPARSATRAGAPGSRECRSCRAPLKEAEVLIEGWRKQYNRVRPHSSLGYRPPAPEAVLLQPAALRSAGSNNPLSAPI